MTAALAPSRVSAALPMIAAVGVDYTSVHKYARALFTVHVESDANDLVARVLDHECIDEAAVLTTCNRVEVYFIIKPGASDDQQTDAIAHATDSMRAVGMARDSGGVFSYIDRFDKHHRVRRGSEAVLHLSRVATGLESARKGDVAILRQVREMYQRHTTTGACGPVLSRALSEAVRCARALHWDIHGQIRDGATRPRIIADLAARMIDFNDNYMGIALWGMDDEAVQIGAHVIVENLHLNVIDRESQRADRDSGTISMLCIDQSRGGSFSHSSFDAERRHPTYIGTSDLIICSGDAPIIDNALIDSILSYQYRHSAAPYLPIIDLTENGCVDAAVLARDDVQVMTAHDIDAMFADELAVHNESVAQAEARCDKAARQFEAAMMSRLLGTRIQQACDEIDARMQDRLDDLRCSSMPVAQLVAAERDHDRRAARLKHERIVEIRAELGIATGSRPDRN